MLGYIMVKDMTPEAARHLQKFADFGVQIGVVPEKIDVTKSSSRSDDGSTMTAEHTLLRTSTSAARRRRTDAARRCGRTSPFAD